MDDGAMEDGGGPPLPSPAARSRGPPPPAQICTGELPPLQQLPPCGRRAESGAAAARGRGQSCSGGRSHRGGGGWSRGARERRGWGRSEGRRSRGRTRQAEGVWGGGVRTMGSLRVVLDCWMRAAGQCPVLLRVPLWAYLWAVVVVGWWLGACRLGCCFGSPGS